MSSPSTSNTLIRLLFRYPTLFVLRFFRLSLLTGFMLWLSVVGRIVSRGDLVGWLFSAEIVSSGDLMSLDWRSIKTLLSSRLITIGTALSLPGGKILALLLTSFSSASLLSPFIRFTFFLRPTLTLPAKPVELNLSELYCGVPIYLRFATVPRNEGRDA